MLTFVLKQGRAGAESYAKEGGWDNVEQLIKEFKLEQQEIEQNFFPCNSALALGVIPITCLPEGQAEVNEEYLIDAACIAGINHKDRWYWSGIKGYFAPKDKTIFFATEEEFEKALL